MADRHERGNSVRSPAQRHGNGRLGRIDRCCARRRGLGACVGRVGRAMGGDVRSTRWGDSADSTTPPPHRRSHPHDRWRGVQAGHRLRAGALRRLARSGRLVEADRDQYRRPQSELVHRPSQGHAHPRSGDVVHERLARALRNAGTRHSRIDEGRARPFRRCLADQLDEGAGGGARVPHAAYPAAAALSSCELLAAVETDTTTHVVAVQRFSAAGVPAPKEFEAAGYPATVDRDGWDERVGGDPAGRGRRAGLVRLHTIHPLGRRQHRGDRPDGACIRGPTSCARPTGACACSSQGRPRSGGASRAVLSFQRGL